MVNKT